MKGWSLEADHRHRRLYRPALEANRKQRAARQWHPSPTAREGRCGDVGELIAEWVKINLMT